METAQRVPGLEGELDQQRQKTRELKTRNTELEQLLEERDGTIEKLRTLLKGLRAAGDEITALMATAPSPAAAGYHAARTLLAHADQFHLDNTAEGRTGLEAMRELTKPQEVALLYRYRRLQSAHATKAAAQEAAQRQGVDPDGWMPGTRHMNHHELADTLSAPWTIATLTVDVTAPWTTPREPLTSVYILMSCGVPYAAFSSPDDAMREQDRQGIPRTADSLIRLELETADSAAAA